MATQTTQAAAQQPAALLAQFRGDVKVVAAADGTEVPAKVGLRLGPGDRVEVARGSRAVLLFSDGRLVTATSTVEVGTGGSAAAGASGTSFQRALRTLADAEDQARPPESTASGRPTQSGAYPVAPAHHATVLTVRPTLVWSDEDGARGYTLQIRPLGGGRPRRFDIGPVASWTLPDTVSPLQPGESYAWTVVPQGARRVSREARFRIIDAEGWAAVEAFQASLVQAGVDPSDDGLLLTAAFYADLGLLYEAERALRALGAQGVSQAEAPVVDLLRAHVYERLGEMDAARRAWDRAQATGR